MPLVPAAPPSFEAFLESLNVVWRSTEEVRPTAQPKCIWSTPRWQGIHPTAVEQLPPNRLEVHPGYPRVGGATARRR